jgi:hypothetical protein
MDAIRLPFFRELEPARRVLVAGAGGGFDVFTGLPLYFALREQGKSVFLANLTFTELYGASGQLLSPAVLEVTADSGGSTRYFPERDLAAWFRAQGEEVPVYCFARTGVVPLRAAWQAVVDHLAVDTIVLADGGTDSLMRGDEVGLGTPEEDMATIAAVDDITGVRKFLACIAFGADTFHGVCHYYVLEAVAALAKAGGFLGAFSLTSDMPAVARYAAATRAVLASPGLQDSNINRGILAALDGTFGAQRTVGDDRPTMWINPLMPIYWFFHLDPVADRVLYLEDLKRTRTFREICTAIVAFQARQGGVAREWRDIPI